jgi:hypothetical protein
MNESNNWREEFRDKFPDGLYDCIPDGEIFFGKPNDEFSQVEAFIEKTRKDAAREALEEVMEGVESQKAFGKNEWYDLAVNYSVSIIRKYKESI